MRPVRDPLISDAARIARAISHPVRLQILNELRDDGAYVMHLTAVLERPQANISQHLMVLREAGLVQATREGMTVLYRISDPMVLTVVDALLSLADKRIRQRDDIAAAALKLQRGGRGHHHGQCNCPRCRQH